MPHRLADGSGDGRWAGQVDGRTELVWREWQISYFRFQKRNTPQRQRGKRNTLHNEWMAARTRPDGYMAREPVSGPLGTRPVL